jgi:hypothetical protein
MKKRYYILFNEYRQEWRMYHRVYYFNGSFEYTQMGNKFDNWESAYDFLQRYTRWEHIK